MGKHLRCSLFLITLKAYTATTLLETDSNTVGFLWVLQNFNNSFFIEHFRWLLLEFF